MTELAWAPMAEHKFSEVDRTMAMMYLGHEVRSKKRGAEALK